MLRGRSLTGGPWLFAGKPMVLQQWTPTMPMTKQTFSSLPLWVRFWNVPVSLWSAQGLSEVASAVGRPLYEDSQTELGQMVNFARICIEVEASRPLITSFSLSFPYGKHCIEVDYQWKPLVCVSYSVFVHDCAKKQSSGQGDYPIPSGGEAGGASRSKDGEKAGGLDTPQQHAAESNASTQSTQGYCPYTLLVAESIMDPPKKNPFAPLVEDETEVEKSSEAEAAEDEARPEVQVMDTEGGADVEVDVHEAGEKQAEEGLGSLLDRDVPSTAVVEKLVQAKRGAKNSKTEQSKTVVESGIDLSSNSNAGQVFADSSVLFVSVLSQTEGAVEEAMEEDNVVFETPAELIPKRTIVVALQASQEAS